MDFSLLNKSDLELLDMNVGGWEKRILADLRDAEYTDEQLSKMSPRELFEKFCEWHGLIGWANTLWGVVGSLTQYERMRNERDTARKEPCNQCLHSSRHNLVGVAFTKGEERLCDKLILGCETAFNSCRGSHFSLVSEEQVKHELANLTKAEGRSLKIDRVKLYRVRTGTESLLDAKTWVEDNFPEEN